MPKFVTLTDDRDRPFDLNTATVGYFSPLGGSLDRGTAVSLNFTTGLSAATRVLKVREAYPAVSKLLSGAKFPNFVEVSLANGHPAVINADNVCSYAAIPGEDAHGTTVTFVFAAGENLAARTIRLSDELPALREKLAK